MMKKFLCFILSCLWALLSFSQDTVYFDKYNNAHLGSYAPNFSILLRDSTKFTKIYDIKADTLILFFYDPNCDDCHKEIKKLAKDKKLKAKLKQGVWKIIAICPDMEKAYWQNNAPKLPEYWTDAFSSDYDIMTTKYLWKVPQMFVLDRQKRIIHKNMYRKTFGYE